jgi:hypothetical protein
MKRSRWWQAALSLVAVALPGVASAGGMSVTVAADRGANAVYQPGERIQITARCTDDANLLVYDIDAEGKISVLFPYHAENGYIEGHQTVAIPSGSAQDELVVQGPVGQGYIVAITSRSPFRDLPWYLRPYNPQAEGVGYVGAPDSTADNEEGITPQGTIVGDPFVAMERIRRRVLSNPDDQDAFATAYVSYYVHQQVNYPRYVCADCHRPGYWAWWDGFDPYYASCSAVSFHVNFGWYWGWPYWGGYVPYYVYVVRPGCPPYYRPWIGACYSSWDGWARWNTMWGAHIVRYKPAAPPATYVSPAQWRWTAGWQNNRQQPPGFMVTSTARGASRMPVTPVSSDPVVARTDWRPGGELRAPVGRAPAPEVPPVPGGQGVTVGAASRAYGRDPAGQVQGRANVAAPGGAQSPTTAAEAARRAADRAGSQNNVQNFRQNQQPPDPARTAVPGPARYYQRQGPSFDQQRYYQRQSAPGYGQPRYQRPGPSGYPQRNIQRSGPQHYGQPGGGRSGGGARGQHAGNGGRQGRS